MTQRRRGYQRDVAEQTERLRKEDSFEDLRSLLRRRRIDASSALLAACVEDSNGNEFGVIVTPDRRVYEYKRRVRLWKTRPRLLAWQDRTGDAGFERECPHVVAALEIFGKKPH